MTRISWRWRSAATAALSRSDLAAISSFSEIAIFGGIETVADGGATGRVYRLGAEGDFGNATVGIKRVQYSQFPLPLDSTELYVDYAFGDRITANASYRAYDDSGQPDFIAIGAEYEFSEFGYVDAGYLDSTSSGISPIYEISVGVKF